MKMAVNVVLWSSYTHAQEYSYINTYTNIYTYIKIIAASIDYALLLALNLLKPLS